MEDLIGNKMSKRSSEWRRPGAAVRETGNVSPSDIDILVDVFLLLEHYAPSWYTVQIHEQMKGLILSTAQRAQ